MRPKKVISLLILSLLSVSSLAAAQDALYKWDAGVDLGVSGYTGEANDGFIFRRPGFSADLTGRYNFNSRLGLSADLGFMTLSGNTADLDNVYPGGLNYNFSASVFSLDMQGEFNFFPFGVGETYKQLKRWTPYIALGVGGLMSCVEGGNHFAFQMPFSIGVKLKLRERLNMKISLKVGKVFGDRVDGDLADLYTIKSNFLKNTDWYSTLNIGLTYEFGERCPTCNRSN